MRFVWPSLVLMQFNLMPQRVGLFQDLQPDSARHLVCTGPQSADWHPQQGLVANCDPQRIRLK